MIAENAPLFHNRMVVINSHRAGAHDYLFYLAFWRSLKKDGRAIEPWSERGFQAQPGLLDFAAVDALSASAVKRLEILWTIRLKSEAFSEKRSTAGRSAPGSGAIRRVRR